MNGTAYLGHPIDFAENKLHGFKATAEQVCSELYARGFAVYRPATAWVAQAPMSEVIQKVNQTALLAADVAVFIWDQECKSFGVPFEIGVAHTRGIPTVVMCNDPVRLRHHSAMFAWANLRLVPMNAVEAAASMADTVATKKGLAR